jgi:glutathione S-transferase kappa 1
MILILRRISGNKPPWTLPAKAKYGAFDARRSALRVNKPEISPAKDFMSMTMTILPLRALHHIKLSYPAKVFETAFHYLFYVFWTPPNLNITKPDVLLQVLSSAPEDFVGAKGKAAEGYEGSKKLFSIEEAEAIVAAASDVKIKECLKRTTQEALDKGAFGAPWMWVTNDKGKGEPFFGSDR